MPRIARVAPGGMAYHVLNRGVGRRALFETRDDYAAFEGLLEETLAKTPMRVRADCLMPNHWHFVLWPEGCTYPNRQKFGEFQWVVRKTDFS